MDRKPTSPIFQTWQFYSACLHYLGMPHLATLFHRAERQIHRWASDPDTTESHQRNPMDRYESLLGRLMAMGQADIAMAAVRRQAHVVGCELSRINYVPPSDKASLAEECLDDVPALADFHSCLMDRQTTAAEIREVMAATIQEIRQNYHRWCQENGEVP